MLQALVILAIAGVFAYTRYASRVAR
jgi:hypothetical protein